MLTPDEQTRASRAQSEREELIDILDPDAGRICMAPHASAVRTVDRILAAGYHNGPRVPAEGTLAWEEAVNRAARAIWPVAALTGRRLLVARAALRSALATIDAALAPAAQADAGTDEGEGRPPLPAECISADCSIILGPGERCPVCGGEQPR